MVREYNPHNAAVAGSLLTSDLERPFSKELGMKPSALPLSGEKDPGVALGGPFGPVRSAALRSAAEATRARGSRLSTILAGIMHEGFAFITIDENDLPYRSVGSFRDFRSEYDVCSSHKQSWSLLKSRNTGKMTSRSFGISAANTTSVSYISNRSLPQIPKHRG